VGGRPDRVRPEQSDELVGELVPLGVLETCDHPPDRLGHRVLPGAMHESTAAYEVAHVLFVRPDVAAVKVRQRPVTLDGRLIEDENEGSPLYVMAKENGHWRLVACQNTEVLSS
jgi:hypothetical protein